VAFLRPEARRKSPTGDCDHAAREPDESDFPMAFSSGVRLGQGGVARKAVTMTARVPK
jgi:hypothetical protein